MTSDFLVVGNIKMHASRVLLADYAARVRDQSFGLLVPYPYLAKAQEMFAHSNVWVGAQSMSSEQSGSYTGQVSGEMLQDIGINRVLIGHSEVRNLGEDIEAKLHIACRLGLQVIYCVGEDATAYQNGQREAVIAAQLAVLPDLPSVVVAYEPVWSIGTGNVPDYKDINVAVTSIKQWLSENMTGVLGENKVLYGGSINNRNCEEVRSHTDVDGFLIGGAALDPETMLEVIERCK